MYATPIIYPLSEIENENIRMAVLANPMSSVIETFRFAFTGSGDFSWLNLGYSFGFMLVLLVFGVLSFNKVEKTFMDTV